MTPSSQALNAVARYLAGWRAILLGAVLVATFVIALLAGDGSIGTALAATAIVVLVFTALVPLIALEAERVSSWSKKQGDVMSPSRVTAHQSALSDAVLAGATRAWSEPTTQPWPAAAGGPRPVLLLVGAAYHLAEVIPLANELERRGIPARIAVGEAHWDRVRQGLVGYTGDVYALPSPEAAAATIAALVVMKDWAGYRPYVDAAKEGGLPTLAKVEGAQDFDEIDTGRDFRPYRTADTILCQGENDVAALPGSRVIVGSTRLERLRRAPLRMPRQRLAVINLNFSYGVLTTCRAEFLETAIAGCVEAGMPYVISVHPAMKSYPRDPEYSTIPIARLLESASVLVSRFSTVPFEAMARGVPFVYHNPHGELVPTFQSPEEAFRITTTAGELTAAIEESQTWLEDYRDRSATFFDAQVDIDVDRRSEERAADVVEALLAGGQDR